MKNKILVTFLAMGAGCFTSGCEKVRESFGLSRNQHDEFTVPPRPLLDAPATLDLAPPQPGTPAGRHRPDAQARRLLVPSSDTQSSNIGEKVAGIEENFLREAGADKASPDIRHKLSREGTVTNREKTLTERILFWQKQKPHGDVINPREEVEKLEKKHEKNSADGY